MKYERREWKCTWIAAALDLTPQTDRRCRGNCVWNECVGKATVLSDAQTGRESVARFKRWVRETEREKIIIKERKKEKMHYSITTDKRAAMQQPFISYIFVFILFLLLWSSLDVFCCWCDQHISSHTAFLPLRVEYTLPTVSPLHVQQHQTLLCSITLQSSAATPIYWSVHLTTVQWQEDMCITFHYIS